MTLSKDFLQKTNFDNFVVLDLETTGLDPATDKIIEIGAIRFVDGKESETFECLVNPGMPIPDFITKLTGISDQDVSTASSIEEKFDSLLEFLNDSVLIGHQINFDASFIEYLFRKKYEDYKNWDNEAQRFKYLNNLRLDTLFLARIFLPFLEKQNDSK